MLLRSTSTGVLTSLVSVGSGLELQGDHFPTAGKTSVPSTPTNSRSSSHVADDARSVDGGDWDFNSGGSVPWPRVRKVMSESDLQSLCRASSNSSSVFAAAESLLSAPAVAPEVAPEVVETVTSTRKSWSRRTKTGLRRGSSLSVIPSARHMEIEDSIAELAESLIPMSTVEDSDEYQGSPRYLNQSGSIDRQLSQEVAQTLHSVIESSAASSFSSVSKSHFETTWEDVYDQNDYVVSSLASEFASFSGRHGERQAGEAASMSVAVESSKVGLMFGSQRGSVAQESFGPMYITDLGFGNGGNGGAHKVSGGGSEGGAGDTRGAEAHYRKQLKADPENALLLRNYAKFLHEVLKEPHRAEVYYERAILANPSDGEVLGAYAKLIWDVYKDEDRAGRYFDQALEANPDDCYLNAAYAAFLWSSEDGPEEEENSSGSCYMDNFSTHPVVYGTAAAASA